MEKYGSNKIKSKSKIIRLINIYVPNGNPVDTEKYVYKKGWYDAFIKKVKEILKCGKDPAYFLKTYARISHPMHGLILFDTYDFQDELLKD